MHDSQRVLCASSLALSLGSTAWLRDSLKPWRCWAGPELELVTHQGKEGWTWNNSWVWSVESPCVSGISGLAEGRGWREKAGPAHLALTKEKKAGGRGDEQEPFLLPWFPKTHNPT